MPTLDGPVLRVLAGTTKPLTGREVHRLAGTGSEAGIRRVLHRLVEHGLVQVAEAGPSLLFTANRDHLAWAAVEDLARMRERFLERLTGRLAQWDPAPVLAGLFGSAARGSGATESDIDILLVRPNGIPGPLADSSRQDARTWAAQIDALRDNARSMTGNVCHVYEINESEFQDTLRSGDPLGDSWRRDLIVLAGRAPWGRATRFAASDAICGQRLGRRSRGQDHRQAADLLKQVEPGGVELAQALLRVLDVKDASQYGAKFLDRDRTAGALRQAERLLDAAEAALAP